MTTGTIINISPCLTCIVRSVSRRLYLSPAVFGPAHPASKARIARAEIEIVLMLPLRLRRHHYTTQQANPG
jgi:hypothetical protein